MARKVTIELTSDEDIKLRGALLDIREGAEALASFNDEENHDATGLQNQTDQAIKIGENIIIALDEIQSILDC